MDISRRAFLGLGGLAGAGVAMYGLSGCSPTTASEPAEETSETSQEAVTPESVEVTETLDADVVVVGGGTSGLTAAVQAAESGANVIIVEKASDLGGSGPFAEGIFAANSVLQKEMGFEESPKSLLQEEYEFQNYKVNPKLLERLVNNSAANIDWLMEKGVEFAYVAATGGTYPTWHVYGGGNHGRMIIDALVSAADKAGVTVKTGHVGTAVVKQDGAVTGFLAEKSDGTYLQINAPAVILATGGCSANEEMIAELRPVNMNRIQHRGVEGMTGDGIRIAHAAGGRKPSTVTLCLIATTVKGISLTNHITVAGAMEPMQLWVNQDSERFVTEDIAKHYTRATNAVLMQKEVYSFVDKTILDKLATEGTRFGAGAYVVPGTKLENIYSDLDEAIEGGNPDIYKADTLEELVKAMGLDEVKMVKTIEEYNGYCEKGVDEQYGKDSESLVALVTPPFYGFRVISNLMNTMGGIKIDTDCLVLDEDDNPISGLYAVGMDCDGFAGETYGIVLPGSDQGICVCTGRIAGEHAAKFALS